MPHIIICDDDTQVRLMYTRWMIKYLYDVTVVDDGSKVIDLLQKKCPCDLIITDGEMRMVDGYGVLKHVMDNGLDIPVILVSGCTAGAVGFTATLQKPVGEDELVSAVQEALEPLEEG